MQDACTTVNVVKIGAQKRNIGLGRKCKGIIITSTRARSIGENRIDLVTSILHYRLSSLGSLPNPIILIGKEPGSAMQPSPQHASSPKGKYGHLACPFEKHSHSGFVFSPTSSTDQSVRTHRN